MLGVAAINIYNYKHLCGIHHAPFLSALLCCVNSFDLLEVGTIIILIL